MDEVIEERLDDRLWLESVEESYDFDDPEGDDGVEM